jgi:hypothetical protein
MNPYTGHLIERDAATQVSPDYSRIPKRLEAEARRAMKDATETYIDLNSNSPLANWAEKKRKAKAKKKIAAASRKRNRK